MKALTWRLAAILLAGSLCAEPVPVLVTDGRLDLEGAVSWFEDLYRASSSEALVEFTVTKPRGTRSMVMRTWSKGSRQALVVIESPARDKGTATLRVEDNLWNYLPRIQRTIRIPPSMMQASWMGSDFTNDDLVRESSFREDYSYELVGPVASPLPGWLIRFDARPGVAGLWKRFELVVSEDGLLPLSAQYFDRRGELSRTLSWSEVKDFDGRRIPTRMLLVPEDRDGHRTELVYREIRFDLDLPDRLFSLSSLEEHR